MKKIFIVGWLFIVGSVGLAAQTGAVNGYCTQGALQSVTNGASSTNYLQGIVPACTVTVYLTGTTTLATIYSNSTNTSLANPFKATYYGQWLFYGNTGQGYDVVMTGGTYPNFYTAPVKITDIFAGSGGGGGGVPGGSPGQVQWNNAGAFAGFTLGGDCSLVTSTGVITCVKSSGTLFGTAAFDNTGTSGATIPLLNGVNTWSGLQTHSAGINLSGASSPLELTGSAGTLGQLLTSAGAGSTPTWSASPVGNSTAPALAFYNSAGQSINPLVGNSNIILAQANLEVPASPFTSEICTGDSITEGTGQTSQANSYCSLIGYTIFSQITNNGLGGHQTGDLTNTIYGYTVPANTRYLYTYMLGTNDVSFWGANTNSESNFALEQAAQVAWIATPSTVKQTAQGGSCTYSGTWANGPFYTGIEKTATTSGATATCAVTGTTVCVATTMVNSNAGTATMTVDSGSPISLPLVGVGGQSLTTNLGVNSGPALTCSTGLSTGSHSVVIAVTNSSGTTYFDWISGYSSTSGSTYPWVIYNSIPAENPVDTVTPVYNTYVSSNATTLQGYGLTNILYNNTYPVLNSPNYFYGNLHPNNQGAWLLAQSEYNTLSTAGIPISPFTPFTGGILYNNAVAGSQSIGTGYEVLSQNTANDNTGFGFQSCSSTTTGGDNTCLGDQTLANNTTGTFNTMVGSKAGEAITTGVANTAVGYGSLFTETTGTDNTAIGDSASLFSNGSTDNTSVGYQAYENGSGTQNVAIGFLALKATPTAAQNTAVGAQSLQNDTGASNAALGYGALFAQTSATDNTGTGFEAGFDVSTGSFNTEIGALAGVTLTGSNADKTGSNNTRIGYATGAFNSAAQSNSIAIGYETVTTGSSQVAIGSGSAATILGPGCSLSSDIPITGTTFTTSICAMQTVPINTTLHGQCAIIWEQSTAAATVSFGAGMSAAPTDLFIASDIPQAASSPQYNIQTATAATLLGSALTPGATATPYLARFYFGLVTGGTNAVTVTFYGLTSNASDSLVIKAGSGCSWLP